MTRTEIFGRIKELIKEQFNCSVIDEDTLFEDIPDWDSFGHITFLGRLQESFGVKLSFEEVISIDGVKAAVDCIAGLIG